MEPIFVLHQASGRPLAEKAFRAENAWERAWGWLGKTKLTPGEGLLLQPCSSVHSFFMRCTLDLVFLDKADQVVRLFPAFKPWRVGAAPASKVLELPEGTLKRVTMQVGDKLSISARKA